MARVRYANVSPEAALKQMALMVQRAVVDPTVIQAAKAITSQVAARDDMGEIEAVFDAVKTGTSAVPGMEDGVRYVADPQRADFYTAPATLLKSCASGACGGDCDDSAMLVSALSSIGFNVGLRGYASSGKKGDFDHVYAVVAYPKEEPNEEIGLDTTVPSSYVGWQPPKAYVLTAWLTNDD